MLSPFRPLPSPEDIQARVDRVVPSLAAHCSDQGWPVDVCRSLARTARHLVAWLVLHPAEVAELDVRGVEGFLRHDCDCPAAFRSELHKGTRRQAVQVLDFLIETGQAAVPAPVASGGTLVEELWPPNTTATCTGAASGRSAATSLSGSICRPWNWTRSTETSYSAFSTTTPLARIPGSTLDPASFPEPPRSRASWPYSAAFSSTAAPLRTGTTRCRMRMATSTLTPSSTGCATIAASARQPSAITSDSCARCCRCAASVRTPGTRRSAASC